MLKPHGYVTGQFGKNHFGDLNKYLPTVHGFDEFYGNLYHLNAEEEPEHPDYPKDPKFRERFGPRGVIHSKATDVDDPTEDPRFGRIGKQTIEDKIPKRATTGNKLRLKEHHLLLTINVANDPRFELSNNGNLTTTLKIAPHLAALGGKVDVPTMDGTVTMTLPPGTSSGAKLRLKGKGMPKRGGNSGDDHADLFAKVMIDVPKELTEAQKTLYEKLRDISD